MISVRPAAFIPASSRPVFSACGSGEASRHPENPAEPAPCGSASPITTTALRGISANRQPCPRRSWLAEDSALRPRVVRAPPGAIRDTASATAFASAVIGWRSSYSGVSPASLNWTTANRALGARARISTTSLPASRCRRRSRGPCSRSCRSWPEASSSDAAPGGGGQQEAATRAAQSAAATNGAIRRGQPTSLHILAGGPGVGHPLRRP